MLQKVFRTKEGKIIAAILGVVIIIVLCIIIINNAKVNQQAKQAMMAENYLKAGNYEQAVEVYLQAMSIADSDKELLTIGLADAYIGLEDYDKAIEILRSFYQKTSTDKIKNKIEEVTSAKTDYEFLQSISRGNRYFTNQEYDKAITEYEKAKLIKSKDAISYEKIAEAYIAKEEYDLAEKEIVEGKEILQNDELDDTMARVEAYVYKTQYDEIIGQAEEYVYQENFENGIQKYTEAIVLLPKEAVAYQGLASVYITQEEYDKAVYLLESAILLIDDAKLKELYKQATQLKEVKDQKSSILSELRQAMKNMDIVKLKAILGLTFFQENMVTEKPSYYGTNMSYDQKDYDLIVIDKKSIYYGDIEKGMKKGLGTYFYLIDDTGSNYRYYDGEWYNDLPSGVGKTVEVIVTTDENGESIENKTVTEGIFHNGFENDTMKKRFYNNEEETGSVLYSAQNGIPRAIENPTMQQEVGLSYPIAYLMRGGVRTDEYYYVEQSTVWGFEPYMKKKYEK